jgi:Rap1a immunity proteins
MTNRVRIIKHEAVKDCGSFEVRFPDGRPSQYFYWDDQPSRRLRPETLDRETVIGASKGGGKGRTGDRLSSLAVPAFAAPDVNSANFILPHCLAAQKLDKPSAFMAGLCAGIIDAIVGVSSDLPEKMRFCAPPGSTNAQQQRVVVLYAEKHPERLHENFKHFVVEALRETWPCP